METKTTLLIKKISRTMLVFTALWLTGASSAKAQHNFTIPDPNFAAYLNTLVPSAMSGGNLMDTTSTDVTSLITMSCGGSGITDLSGVQYFTNLKYLYCNGNNLTSLPALPPLLIILNCSANQLTSLPVLPDSLSELDCFQNQLTSLPALPTSGTFGDLDCSQNMLTSLPALPSGMTFLNCPQNHLASLPALPNEMEFVHCGQNTLTNLPVLPAGLRELLCGKNHLTSLPALPDGIQTVDCDSNYISCFLPFPNSIINFVTQFNISGNPFTCLPNYIAAMDAGTLAFPLCTPGNPNGCSIAAGIVGYTFKDNNSNCTKDGGDQNLMNVPMKQYDGSGTLLSQTYTAVNGIYDFNDTTAGTYNVSVDTTGMPFVMQCGNPGLDSTVLFTGLDTSVNFSLTGKPGFDVGVQSAVTTGLIFPGLLHDLRIVAGDMTQWYNLNTAAGISGTVQITVTGPVTYSGHYPGALTPSIAGNTYTYTIADFSAVTNTTAFDLWFTTDTTATLGDMICVSVTVTPGTDYNSSNNTYSYCYAVSNSHDPNAKETYPVNVAPHYNDWFTYTVHFQNTGNAAAMNILLADTLDNNLDVSTFQLINYSHNNTVMLKGNALDIRFNDINLPDSASNYAGSIGFVQYRIKPKGNLPTGTIIKNTAAIYFDYNAAVVTNTTQNFFTDVTTSIAKSVKATEGVSVYPNPFGDNTTFMIQSDKTNETYSFEMTDVLGKQVKSLTGISTKQFQISRSGLENGIYFYKIYNAGSVIGIGKVVIR